MHEEEDIEFEQLVKLVKRLPVKQWSKLKREVEKSKPDLKQNSDLVSLLLLAPTYSKEQLNDIAKNRKAINQWRTK